MSIISTFLALLAIPSAPPEKALSNDELDMLTLLADAKNELAQTQQRLAAAQQSNADLRRRLIDANQQLAHARHLWMMATIPTKPPVLSGAAQQADYDHFWRQNPQALAQMINETPCTCVPARHDALLAG